MKKFREARPDHLGCSIKAHCRTIPFLCKLLGLPDTFYKGCEALELGGQTTDEVGEGPAGTVGPPEATPPVPCIKTSTANRKRRVAVAGDSPLRGTEASLCRLDPARVEVCCLSRARKRDITGKLMSPVRISDYYLLLVVQTGSGLNKNNKEKSETYQKRLQGPGMIGRRTRSTGSDFLDFSSNTEYN